MNSHAAQALRQVARVEQLCDFGEHPGMKAAVAPVPVTLPPALGALGFDIPLWVGFGTVGLWAALDAFAERAGISSRCQICGKNRCVFGRFFSHAAQGNDATSLKELEDLRHLYAHNFAGEADDEYFKRTRHALKRGVPVALTCGASFGGGGSVQLNLDHLRFYAGVARRVLEQCP